MKVDVLEAMGRPFSVRLAEGMSLRGLGDGTGDGLWDLDEEELPPLRAAPEDGGRYYIGPVAAAVEPPPFSPPAPCWRPPEADRAAVRLVGPGMAVGLSWGETPPEEGDAGLAAVLQREAERAAGMVRARMLREISALKSPDEVAAYLRELTR